MVTIALEAMSFHLPVYVGDVVSCYCSLAKQGNSSVSVKVETWVRRRDRSSEVKVTEGCFTFVAVDKQGKPKKISN